MKVRYKLESIPKLTAYIMIHWSCFKATRYLCRNEVKNRLSQSYSQLIWMNWP